MSLRVSIFNLLPGDCKYKCRYWLRKLFLDFLDMPLLHQMAQIVVVLNAFHFTYNNMQDIGFYTFIITLNFLLHFILARLINKRKDLWYLLIDLGLGGYLFIIHYNFSVEDFLLDTLIIVIRYRTDKHTLCERCDFGSRNKAV